MTPRPGSKQVTDALRHAAEALEGARRFHGDTLGKDVDPGRCLADWLLKVAARDGAGLEKVYGSARTKAALSASASGAQGGYLVPPELRDDLMQDVAEEAIIRPLALVVPMTSATLQLPLPDAATAPTAAGTPSFFGGVRLTWSPEAQTEAETEPALRQVELRANDLTGYAVASNPLQDDGGKGLEKYLRRLFARSVAWFEDYAFLRGTGAGQPLGMLAGPGTLSVTRGTVNKILYVDAAAMLTKLLPHSFINAAWVLSVSGIVQLVQLVDASGKTAWGPNTGERSEGRSVGSLFGRTIFPSEKLPVLGTKGDLMLFDPTLYVIGDRQALEVAASPHVRFLSNQTVWRFTERVDGQPWYSAPITLQDTSTQVSPVVVLN